MNQVATLQAATTQQFRRNCFGALIQQPINCLLTWKSSHVKTDGFGSDFSHFTNCYDTCWEVIKECLPVSWYTIHTSQQCNINNLLLYSPVAKLWTPQTGHGILQVLAKVKDILHGSFPLGFRVCGSAAWKKKKKKGCKSFRTSWSNTDRGGCFMWTVLLERAEHACILFPRTLVRACIICSWTDMTFTSDMIMPLKWQIPSYGLIKQFFFFTYADKVHIKNDKSNAIPTHQLYVEEVYVLVEFKVNSESTAMNACKPLLSWRCQTITLL